MKYEQDKVKKTIVVEASVILAMIQELEALDGVGGNLPYRKGQYNELLTLLDLLYDMNPTRVDRILKKSIQGIQCIDYKAIFDSLDIK